MELDLYIVICICYFWDLFIKCCIYCKFELFLDKCIEDNVKLKFAKKPCLAFLEVAFFGYHCAHKKQIGLRMTSPNSSMIVADKFFVAMRTYSCRSSKGVPR